MQKFKRAIALLLISSIAISDIATAMMQSETGDADMGRVPQNRAVVGAHPASVFPVRFPTAIPASLVDTASALDGGAPVSARGLLDGLSDSPPASPLPHGVSQEPQGQLPPQATAILAPSPTAGQPSPDGSADTTPTTEERGAFAEGGSTHVREGSVESDGERLASDTSRETTPPAAENPPASSHHSPRSDGASSAPEAQASDEQSHASSHSTPPSGSISSEGPSKPAVGLVTPAGADPSGLPVIARSEATKQPRETQQLVLVTKSDALEGAGVFGLDFAAEGGARNDTPDKIIGAKSPVSQPLRRSAWHGPLTAAAPEEPDSDSSYENEDEAAPPQGEARGYEADRDEHGARVAPQGAGRGGSFCEAHNCNRPVNCIF